VKEIHPDAPESPVTHKHDENEKRKFGPQQTDINVKPEGIVLELPITERSIISHWVFNPLHRISEKLLRYNWTIFVQLTIAKKMAACIFYQNALRASRVNN
jgi:hypothetical protein